MTKKQENPLLSLALNIVIPSIILMKFSGPDRLGPVVGVVSALSFPIIYGIYDFIQRKTLNFISVLGLISAGLTGFFTLNEFPPEYIAIKEAAVPGIIGLAILGSMKTNFPLVRKMIFNDSIMNIKLVEEKLTEKGNMEEFNDLLNRSSYLFAASFFLSSVLNYVLAKVILVSQPGTEAFNEELGQMTIMSYPVIVLPSMIIVVYLMMKLLKGIKQLTGLEWESVLNNQGAKKE
ncbi:MAG: MFS transporter [Pseudobacteriovorax sp.]|nr:MFS transporter [Pseudobacteriovorax sp.]